ncbi:MAG: lysophospholipid acyltransferase family protein [Deltaproteobacteria bacterium]|nr:lysophospholipid acyltransferase family protein [Deltaproteobacteria bacterium]
MYLFARALAFFLRLLPRGVVAAMGTLAGLVWYHVVRIRRRVAEENVAACITSGDRSAARRIVRRNFVKLCRFSLEFAARRAGYTAGVTVEGHEAIREALENGKGAVIATGHVGNWDLNTEMGPIVGIPLHVVTRRIAMEGLQRFWDESRTGRGNTYLARNLPIVELLRVLRGNGCVALVFDQHMPPRRGVRVPFFGREASTAYSPAVLHFRTGAPVFPVFGGLEPDGRYVVRVEAAVTIPSTGDLRADSAKMMTELNRRLENWIRAHPDQWLWAHRRWKP